MKGNFCSKINKSSSANMSTNEKKAALIANGPERDLGGEKEIAAQDLHDLYKIIQVQQNTINKLTAELTKKTKDVSRDVYEKTINELETEKYEHAKTKLQTLDLKEKIVVQEKELEFFRNELEKERAAYANVFDLLKGKALNESSKSINLISKIAETEIRYNDAINDIAQKEKKYSQLCGKIKQKEQNYEQKIQEMNLKLEQDKFINKLIYEQPIDLKPSRKKK